MHGIIDLKPDTAINSFSDIPYSFVSNWVKVRNDSLIFETYINTNAVLFSLKLEDTKIEGEAVWPAAINFKMIPLGLHISKWI